VHGAQGVRASQSPLHHGAVALELPRVVVGAELEAPLSPRNSGVLQHLIDDAIAKVARQSELSPDAVVRAAFRKLHGLAAWMLGDLPELFILACKSADSDSEVAITVFLDGLAALHEALSICSSDGWSTDHALVVQA
jgi:hypothetical protein